MPPAPSLSFRLTPSIGYGAARRRRYRLRVLGHHAALIMRLRRFPILQPRLDFRIGEIDVESPLGDVERDYVAVAYRRDRSRHQAVRRARETPVGQQPD